jgi:hypothetical protein
MPKPEVLIMTQKDLNRLHIIKKVSESRLLQKEAGKLLKLSERQIRRIFKSFKLEGEKGLIHKLRGAESRHKRPVKEVGKILKIYRNNYYDFGPSFASEKLFEINGIKISNESLRQLLIKDGLWTKRRNCRKHRKWRERRAHFGELLQMDGSHHAWLEERGPKMVLMGYIDDATGNAWGRFYEYEGTRPAMDSIRTYIRKYGLPQCVYFDRHSTYKNNNAKLSIEDELNDVEPLSQFSRALKEMGIEFIHAHSPEAKGRVERSFSTHQDRLVKEMRLANIKTMEEANAFLENYYWPKHNKKFSIAPLKSTDLHRRAYPISAIERALCKRTPHPLRNDRTIVHNKQWYQIINITIAKEVVVEERYDGKMFITYKGKPFKFKSIKKPEKDQIQVKGRFKPCGHKPAEGNYFNTSNWSTQSYAQYKKEWEENYITKLAENF